jgi:hypothetical protein
LPSLFMDSFCLSPVGRSVAPAAMGNNALAGPPPSRKAFNLQLAAAQPPTETQVVSDQSGKLISLF